MAGWAFEYKSVKRVNQRLSRIHVPPRTRKSTFNRRGAFFCADGPGGLGKTKWLGRRPHRWDGAGLGSHIGRNERKRTPLTGFTSPFTTPPFRSGGTEDSQRRGLGTAVERRDWSSRRRLPENSPGAARSVKINPTVRKKAAASLSKTTTRREMAPKLGKREKKGWWRGFTLCDRAYQRLCNLGERVQAGTTCRWRVFHRDQGAYGEA